MESKIKTGNINIPDEDFNDENVTAHISIRLPLKLVKDLKRLSLTEEYSGKYQWLIKDVLLRFVENSDHVVKVVTNKKELTRVLSSSKAGSARALQSIKSFSFATVRSGVGAKQTSSPKKEKITMGRPQARLSGTKIGTRAAKK